MRIAVRPCQTVPPHQQVPSAWIAAITRSVALGVAERDEHLVQHDVVQHLVARGAQPVGEARARAGRCARPGRRALRARASAAPPRPRRRARAATARACTAQGSRARALPAGSRRVTAIAARSARGVAHEREAAVVGHVEPLVRVGGPRVGALDARREVGARRRGRGPQAERAVDVHPGARAVRARRRSPRGSKAPVFTLPAWRQTIVGLVERAAARRRASAPAPSTGTRTTRSRPSPSRPSALSTLTCDLVARRRRAIGGAPNRPSASTSQPARASSAWRAAASAGEVRHRRAGDEAAAAVRRAGAARRAASAEPTSSSAAPSGEATRRPAF